MKIALYLLFIFTSLTYGFFFSEEFETGKFYALVSFACFAAFFINWRKLMGDGVAQALFLLTASAAISTIFSIDQHMSFFGNPKCPGGFLTLASFFIAYMAMAKTNEIYYLSFSRDAIRVILGCGTVVAIYAIAQAFGFDFQKWNGAINEYGYIRPMSTFGQPNFMAGYLSMALPFAAYNRDTGKPRLILCTLFCIAIFLSQSRGMMLATFGGLVFLFFVYLRTPIPKVFKYLAPAILGVTICLFLSGNLRHDFRERGSNFLLDSARPMYWAGALKIWQKYPFLGSGTDTFEIAYRNRRTDKYWKMEPGGSPHRAHNDWFNVLANQGLVGVVSFILLALAACGRMKNRFSLYQGQAIASIIAFYIEGLTSFTIIGTGVLFMFNLAILKDVDT